MAKTGKLELGKRDAKLLRRMLLDWETHGSRPTDKQTLSIAKMKRGCYSVSLGVIPSLPINRYDIRVIEHMLDWASNTDWLYKDKMDMWREFDQRLISKVYAIEKELKVKSK